jgi:predicted nicotinamide N-methyase
VPRSRTVLADLETSGWTLIRQSIELPNGELRLLQPEEGAEIPDDHQVEWAPIAPYWSILWRSGVALARELEALDLQGRRVIELGCGLGVPSIAAARAGAVVLATDTEPDALALVARNAAANAAGLDTARVDWAAPETLIEMGPFDLVLGADVLYERPSVTRLLKLLPELAPESLIADPGRPAAEAFLEEARRRWEVETTEHGVVSLHRLRFGAE